MKLIFLKFFFKKTETTTNVVVSFCREEGIRTLDTLPYTHFPGVRLRPLGHLSSFAESLH